MTGLQTYGRGPHDGPQQKKILVYQEKQNPGFKWFQPGKAAATFAASPHVAPLSFFS